MSRQLVLIISLLISSFWGFSQSKRLSQFDTASCSFSGTKIEQAEYLLRLVQPRGVVKKENAVLPDFLSSLLTGETSLISEKDLSDYILINQLNEEEIGGSIQDSIAQNAKMIKAKYFVIHDVSTPNYKLKDFPIDINEETWPYNQVKEKWNIKKAHVFIGRTGKSHSPVYLSTPWRATKFELNVLDEQFSKGLFIHAELIQPRKSDPIAWSNNDIIAPTPGFTSDQYKRLALIYLIASHRSGGYMVPVFHAVLDEGIKGGHDDPQHFSLAAFNDAIEQVYTEITQLETTDLWATYYYVPKLNHSDKGIELLDINGNGLGLKLEACDWCDACIEGTVIVLKDNQHHVLNYAGRSTNLQLDCRTCSKYKKYDGYEKTGKVLWQRSSGYGQGVKHYRLIPFKSIAVDSTVIPFGSVLFIPGAKGVRYTFQDSSYIHDGYFIATDMGSKIIDNHIDVFIGTATSNPFDFITSDSNHTFKAQFIRDSAVVRRLTDASLMQQDQYLTRFCSEEPCELGTPSGYVNAFGDTIIPYGRYNYCYTDTIRNFGIVLDSNGTCLAIDVEGNYLYDVKWFDNGPDHIVEGLFRVILNDQIGYADAQGNIVIAPQYTCAEPFNQGRAKVTYSCELIDDGEYQTMKSASWFYIDHTGNKIE